MLIKKTVNEVIAVYKPFGLTPLTALNRLREKYPDYQDVKLSYIGRLDPAAEGVMPVLVGEANREREKYLGVDKEYEFVVLFGVSTDTGDVLGRINGMSEVKDIAVTDLKNFFADNIGIINQSYPTYSSPLIAGKKSFYKQIEIYQAEILSLSSGLAAPVAADILAKLRVFNKLNPDQNFRQAEIIADWQKLAANLPANLTWTLAEVSLSASSGTYVRVLAERAGRALGCPALARTIKRTRAGEYGIYDCLVL